MDREAFFEWLNTCPTKWSVVLDDFGNTTIRFEYVELEGLEEVANESWSKTNYYKLYWCRD